MFFYLENNWEMFCNDIEKGIINENIKMPDDLRKKLSKKVKPDPKRANELREEFKKGFDININFCYISKPFLYAPSQSCKSEKNAPSPSCGAMLMA